MTRVYYREAVGAFVVFDVTRISTFEAVNKWKNDLDTKVSFYINAVIRNQNFSITIWKQLPYTKIFLTELCFVSPKRAGAETSTFHGIHILT